MLDPANNGIHDDAMTWERYSRYWPFVRRSHLLTKHLAQNLISFSVYSMWIICPLPNTHIYKRILFKVIIFICVMLYNRQSNVDRLVASFQTCLILNMVNYVFWAISGPWFNDSMSSYQYRKSHCGDKTILRSSHLHNGISYSGKTTYLYWIGAQTSMLGSRHLGVYPDVTATLRVIYCAHDAIAI